MGFGKTWHANLRFSPLLKSFEVGEILAYLDNSGYSVIANYPSNWCDVFPSKRTRAKNDATWGRAAMINAFTGVRDFLAGGHSMSKITWKDARYGGNTSYECNDIGKLLRILKKLKITAKGTVEGEGFAHDGDIYFIEDNSIYSAVFVKGPQVFIDDYESDDEEKTKLTPVSSNRIVHPDTSPHEEKKRVRHDDDPDWTNTQHCRIFGPDLEEEEEEEGEGEEGKGRRGGKERKIS